MMRDDLGNGERGELQRRYLNFYATSYPGIRVAAPFDVQDDIRANTVVVTEHYTVKDFWPEDGQGARLARFHAPEIDNELKTPDEPIRTMPLALHGPQSLREHLHVRLPLAWPERRDDRTVTDGAFKLSKAVRVHDRELTTDYLLEFPKDHVDAAAVAAFAENIGKAQDLSGFSLSTARAGGGPPVSPASLAAIAGAALLAFAWFARRRLRREGKGVPSAPAAVHAVAANDSKQDLAA
jgi:hypothetical protein